MWVAAFGRKKGVETGPHRNIAFSTIKKFKVIYIKEGIFQTYTLRKKAFSVHFCAGKPDSDRIQKKSRRGTEPRIKNRWRELFNADTSANTVNILKKTCYSRDNGLIFFTAWCILLFQK